jgi:Tol biopolymer transport system component
MKKVDAVSCLRSRLQELVLHAGLLTLLAMGLLKLPAYAASFTLEQVMSSPFPSSLVAAPHAGRIAWVFDAKGVRNIWIADSPKFEARQITHYSEDDGQAIPTLSIAGNGRTLVYARGTEVNDEGRVADPTSDVSQRKEQVWAIDVDGGSPRLLGEMDCGGEGCEHLELSPDGQFATWSTRKQLWIAPVSGVSESHKLTDLRGNNAELQWSPDGREIVFTSDRGDHSLVAIYDLGRDKVRYVAPTADRDSMPRWSPDGKQIAFVRREGRAQKVPLLPMEITPWSVWVGDASTLSARQVWHSGSQANDSFPDMTESTPFYFPVNDRIVFASEQDGRNHLYSITVSGGSPVLLTPGEFDIEDTTLSEDNSAVIYSSNQDDVDRRHIWRVSVSGGKPQPLTRGETIEWTPVDVGGQVACLGSTATYAGNALPDYFEWQANTGSERIACRVSVTAAGYSETGHVQERRRPGNPRSIVCSGGKKLARSSTDLYSRRSAAADDAGLPLYVLLPQRLRDESVSGEPGICCAVGELSFGNNVRTRFPRA